MNEYWCEECHRHKFKCVCDLPKHIYDVEYQLTIEVPGPHGLRCQEKVRAIAYDILHAKESVTNWALTTNTIWWFEASEITEHTIPIGARDVQIVRCEKYMHDIGWMLKQMPMPEIMPPEA